MRTLSLNLVRRRGRILFVVLMERNARADVADTEETNLVKY